MRGKTAGCASEVWLSCGREGGSEVKFIVVEISCLERDSEK